MLLGKSKILEFDYAGIEQVVMGWAMNEPKHIRLAKLGLHAYVASHVLKRPADLSWPDPQLAAYFAEIKGAKGPTYEIYDRCKRNVHGTAYGLTPYGMNRTFPKAFPTIKAAEDVQRVYFDVAPWVPQFQTAVQQTAHDEFGLGGARPYRYFQNPEKSHRWWVQGHPYGYHHDFYSVLAYERLSESQRLWREKRRMPTIEINGIWYGIALGEDAKRAMAFYPQSIARGVLTEAALDLFCPPDHPGYRDDLYIGDAYFGYTPLRAPIHDSLLMEVPWLACDRVIEKTFRAMMAPVEELACPVAWGIGPSLTIGVDGKIGDDWDKDAMEAIRPPSVASDTPLLYGDAETEEVEEIADLGVQVA